MAQAAATTPLADDDVEKLELRLLAIRDEFAALDKQAEGLRLARAALIRTIIDQRGWKHVAQLLGVGRTRLYAMRALDLPTDAERRGGGDE